MSNYYHFFVYYDSGICVYKINKGEGLETSMNGIIQALYFTTSDYKFKLKIISSESALLCYKVFTHKGVDLLLALVYPNNFGSEELAQFMMERVLDYIYYGLVMHIGFVDLFGNKTPQDIDKLKKMIEIYEPTVTYFIENYNKLELVLKSEKKVEVSKDVIYPIKYYFNTFKTKMKVDFVCATIENFLLWATNSWLSVDITDRILMKVISQLYGQDDISEIPIYFAKTVLEDDMTGKVPYKLYHINLYDKFKLMIIGEEHLNIEYIYEKLLASEFDSFFQNKLDNFIYNVGFDIKQIDSFAKSVLIQNNTLKTYKIMINEEYGKTFIDFLVNCHFTLNCFAKTSNSDEFYLKSEDFLFYFLNVGTLNIFMIFDNGVSFEEVYNIKKIFKTMKDQIDNKENFEKLEK